MSYGDYNPSDKDGTSRSQGTVIGVVVDNNDPTQCGRVKVRITGEQGKDQSNVADDDLPWYPVLTNGWAMMGGAGNFPAGGCYLPGTRIVMRNMGQQGFLVEGSMQSSRTAQGQEDRHPESTAGTPALVRNAEKKMSQCVLEGSKMLHELESTTERALACMNGELSTLWDRVGGKEKIECILREAQCSIDYMQRGMLRSPPGSPSSPISHKPWDFAMNAQQFVKSIPNAELMKNAVSMLESLKKTAKNSLNPPQIDSLGGIGNIMGALQSILAFIKKHKPKKKDEPIDKKVQEIEDELKRLEELHNAINQDIPTN